LLRDGDGGDGCDATGVTTLDVIRANTFVAAHLKRPFDQANVRVIGGHAGITIIPLLSQVSKAAFSDADRDALTQRIMFGGDEVVKAKAGAGSATLSMAFAGARFANSVLRGLSGDTQIAESFVESSVGGPELSFFASPVQLGPNGAEKVLGKDRTGHGPRLTALLQHCCVLMSLVCSSPSTGYGEINAHEKGLLKAAIPELKSSIQKGIDFAKAFKL
jgi:malate dehydrogenase